MSIVFENAVFGYFEALYNLNRDLLILCGLDACDHFEQFGKQMQDIIRTIPRIVPYSYDKEKKQYKLENNGGLLEYADDISFLREDYQAILDKHYDFLVAVKKVRNKIEHQMHGANRSDSGSSEREVSFDCTYAIAEAEYTIKSDDIIRFMKDINVMFAKIQRHVEKIAYEEDKTYYPYYRRLLRIRFADFNLLYDSQLLKIIGKTLLPF